MMLVEELCTFVTFSCISSSVLSLNEWNGILFFILPKIPRRLSKTNHEDKTLTWPFSFHVVLCFSYLPKGCTNFAGLFGHVLICV